MLMQSGMVLDRLRIPILAQFARAASISAPPLLFLPLSTITGTVDIVLVVSTFTFSFSSFVLFCTVDSFFPTPVSTTFRCLLYADS